ncbi:MAG: hypothetical protein M3Q93_11410, partial [Gemmatimonadota bacterium]|nr:hypothetical protein [Gemmatimonadota bacterium]
RWAATLVARLTGRTEQPSPASADSAPAQAHAGDRGRAGIAVAPGRALTIDFTSSERGGLVRVSLVERGQVVVQAPAGAATFTTDAERLTIEGHGAVDTFAIAIPRDARRVELEAAGTRLLLAERGRVTASAAPDSVGDYLLSLPTAEAK